MLVSICIPCYNAAAYIAETLDSLLRQNHHDLEIIIVDDNSTDGSLEVVKHCKKRDPRIAFYYASGKGAAAARNQAYKLSTGEFIVFLDADDWIPKNFIETQLQTFETREEVVVSAWGRFYQNDLATIEKDINQVDKDLTFEEWILSYWHNASNMTCPGRVLMHKNLIERTGLWNEDLSLNDDFPFFTKLFANSSIIRFNNKSIFHYRSGVNGLSSRKGHMAYTSLFNSLEEAIETARSKFNNNKLVNKSCANLWQNFIYETYPLESHLIEKAKYSIKALGGSDLKFQSGRKTKLLNSFLGWKLVKRIKLYLSNHIQ